MKTDKILEKIKLHKENKQHVTIIREVQKHTIESVNGHILDHSENFILFQTAGDFTFHSYCILPIIQIKKIRFNKVDKYYQKILEWENEIEKVGISYAIDLTTWQSVFKSIKQTNLWVIVECENPDDKSFDIGPIIKVNKKQVSIKNFDAAGYFGEEPSIIPYNLITKVNFDDRYINIFSKYTRERKKNQ